MHLGRNKVDDIWDNLKELFWNQEGMNSVPLDVMLNKYELGEVEKQYTTEYESLVVTTPLQDET